jgi:hypothetical protein
MFRRISLGIFHYENKLMDFCYISYVGFYGAGIAQSV